MKKTLAVALFVVGSATGAMAQTSPSPAQVASTPSLNIPAAAQASPDFDAERATEAYLNTLPPDKQARSDAYFEGGYWLLLWDFLYAVAVLWILLASGLSVRMRDVAERTVRWRPLQIALYWIQFLVGFTVVTFPMTVYEGFVREHQYGLATQTFGPWLGDQAKGLGVGLVLGALAIPLLYAVLRRAGRSWWAWTAALAIAFNAFVVLIAPVFIAPLFNSYTRLTDPAVRDPILSMARANGIQADAVYVVDQSRQTTRISANVSGLFRTMRISVNDNLLKRGSLPEIEAVVGHEMGHYVLNHIAKMLAEMAIVFAVGFAFVGALFDRLGPRWRIRGIGDVAGLPLIALLFSVYQFAATPVTNTIIRTSEYEADIFGLNAARQPDGFAKAALDLADYRKLRPGPIEEFVFYDHPSGHTRIFSAMRWKAEQIKRGAEGAAAPE
jgi:STE24 endopeptidase